MLPLRVVIADDHRLFRQGLIGLMNTRRDLVTVVGEAADGREAVDLARELRPDVVLMDIFMPHNDGMEAAAFICQNLPGVHVIMLTSSEEDDHVYRAMQLGASGYLLKDLDADELFNLLLGIERGEIVMTRAMGARLLRHLTRASVDNPAAELTEREVEVLKLVAQGASNPQIAETLFISINTVKVHLRNILDKLHLENRTQAAAYAVRLGLTSAAV